MNIIEEGMKLRDEASKQIDAWEMTNYLHYVVGIDGSNTPDPKYWQDRWLCFKAPSEAEAIRIYKDYYYLFLRPSEYQHVKVLGTYTSELDPLTVLSQHTRRVNCKEHKYNHFSEACTKCGYVPSVLI
jgi:hypothetical protein